VHVVLSLTFAFTTAVLLQQGASRPKPPFHRHLEPLQRTRLVTRSLCVYRHLEPLQTNSVGNSLAACVCCQPYSKSTHPRIRTLDDLVIALLLC
jgi:hypothetical protein